MEILVKLVSHAHSENSILVHSKNRLPPRKILGNLNFLMCIFFRHFGYQPAGKNILALVPWSWKHTFIWATFSGCPELLLEATNLKIQIAKYIILFIVISPKPFWKLAIVEDLRKVYRLFLTAVRGPMGAVSQWLPGTRTSVQFGADGRGLHLDSFLNLKMEGISGTFSEDTK